MGFSLFLTPELPVCARVCMCVHCMCVRVCVRGDLIYKADPGAPGLAEPGEGLVAVHRPPGRPLASEAPRGDH